ncbi:MAG: DNA-processing protein DprA [Defluviitaleaceae bacterium]|nr:DNA-processing protein DprA [Defluviitaleaceae bacterium]
MHDDIYMLWMSSLMPFISSRKLNMLLEIFGTAKAVFKAKDIGRAVNLTSKAMSIVSKRRNLQYIELLLSEMEAKEMAYFSRNNPRYPALLKTITDAPLGIFCMGTLPADNTHKVAIIGSRKCSEYGLIAARILAEPLAKAGIVIVSGMARGVDSMAHWGALKHGGKTIAVLGCGADICYPSENRTLRHEIMQKGCIISEYPPGTKPQPAFFPARNRIISGLSEGVIVAEASKRSGTLITVDQAIEQGREVLAVPGNISSKLSEGTNQLIRDGAHPVSNAEDVLYALGISPKEIKQNTTETKSHLAPDEKQVYDSLDFVPKSFDILAESTNLESGRLHFICTSLEIKGLIKKLPGSRFVKNP